jgi:hypothetical protein
MCELTGLDRRTFLKTDRVRGRGGARDGVRLSRRRGRPGAAAQDRRAAAAHGAGGPARATLAVGHAGRAQGHRVVQFAEKETGRARRIRWFPARFPRPIRPPDLRGLTLILPAQRVDREFPVDRADAAPDPERGAASPPRLLSVCPSTPERSRRRLEESRTSIARRAFRASRLGRTLKISMLGALLGGCDRCERSPG